ncbi:hypothetical protein BLOT_010326 [Blomia tropicalis]|nr:hypothetical protein BLOT_010326 [Blomia tropicalis]
MYVQCDVTSIKDTNCKDCLEYVPIDGVMFNNTEAQQCLLISIKLLGMIVGEEEEENEMGKMMY